MKHHLLAGIIVFVTFVLSSLPVQANLIILTPEIFKTALQPLKSHKDATGISTYIVTLETINQQYTGNDLPEKVKKAISEYQKDHNVSYVLLVGDTDQFPIRYIQAINTEWGTRYYPSDLYYADLYDSNGDFDDWDFDNDGFYGETDFSGGSDTSKVNLDKINLKPDVVVGRIPASTAAEVTTYVNKVIQYERTNSWRPEWSNKALVISDHNTKDAFAHEWYANAVVNSLDNFSSTLVYKENSPYDAMDQTQLASAISTFMNAGQDLVFHLGHGNQNEWSGFFTSSDMSLLTNSARLPIITTISCLTAAFHYGPEIWQQDKYLTVDGTHWDGQGVTFGERPMPAAIQPSGYDVESMAEEFLIKRTSGAIAYIATVAKSEHGGTALQRYFAEKINEYLTSSWKRTLGEVWMHNLHQFMINDAQPGMGASYAYIHQHKTMLFGDPSLRIGKTVAPEYSDDTPGFNDTVPLTMGVPGDNPTYPKVAYNSNHNEYLVVYHWSNDLLPWLNRQIHAARMTADGEYIANYNISELPNNCAQPDVAYDPDRDQYLITWSYDTYNDGTYWDIYGRFVSRAGPIAASPSFRIGGSSTTAGSKWNSKIAYGTSNEDFFVVNSVIASGQKPFITGFRVPANGSLSWLYTTIKGDPSNFEIRTNPDIAYSNSRHEFMVVYDDQSNIYGHIFNGQATFDQHINITVPEIPISKFMPPHISLLGIHERPAIAYSDPAKFYMITWETNRRSGHGETYARYYPGGASHSGVVPLRIERLDDTEEPDFTTDVACDTSSSSCLALWLRVHDGIYYTFGRRIFLESNDVFNSLTSHDTGFYAPLDNLNSTDTWINGPYLSIAAGKNNFYYAFTGRDVSAVQRIFGKNSLYSSFDWTMFLPAILNSTRKNE